ncbi:hypothetical protein DPMN_117732 [Dreissena polymorpha]|uniref:Uncharacterized protein n=1 Tax=Dreissena polymorpha TaxID=45954 RepID=A0A9D4GFM0_DREPO|nr:hypothetical protein DPMN_117732 [Dreissena polymorpha]
MILLTQTTLALFQAEKEYKEVRTISVMAMPAMSVFFAFKFASSMESDSKWK